MTLINYVTQIQFEFGAIGLLRQQCERVGIRRPLIVASDTDYEAMLEASM